MTAPLPRLLGAAVATVCLALGAGLGPRGELRAQSPAPTWRSLGPDGGRVEAISLDPTTPGTIVVGAYTGGIWRSLDNGATWQPAAVAEDPDGPNARRDLYVTSFVRSPGRPGTLFAATASNPDGLWSALGVLKSTDGGATWSPLASTRNVNQGMMKRLAMSPDDRVLLGNSPDRLHYSQDDGATWASASFATPGNTQILDVTFVTATRAIAASASAPYVWVSDNAGLSWVSATGVTSAVTSDARIVVAPDRPIVYYLRSVPGGEELWTSTNGGLSYAKVRDLDIRRAAADGSSGSEGPATLWVDPANSMVVVVGGLDLWRSTDSGVTFTRISDWSNPDSVAGMVNAIASRPGTSEVYAGTDGGLFRTGNILTATPTGSWQAVNAGLTIPSMKGAVGSAIDGTIVALTANNEVLRFDGGTATWSLSFRPPDGPRMFDLDPRQRSSGRMTAIDPIDPSYVYATDIAGLQGAHALLRSIDGGRTFAYISSPCEFDFPSVSPCLNAGNPQIALADADTLVLTGAQHVYRTNPKEASPSWTNTGLVPSIYDFHGFFSPTTSPVAAPGLAWVYMFTGPACRALDVRIPAPVWQCSFGPAPLAIDPGNPNTVYTSTGYRTLDSGATWAPVWSDTFGWKELFALTVDPRDSNHLFRSNVLGVSESVDGGQTWRRNTPANVWVREFFWMGPRLIAVTRGRGLFALDPVSNPDMNIDAPTGGSSRQPVHLAGWAFDRAATSGVGIDAIHVYAYPDDGGPARFMGVAAYGLARPDVGAAFGSRYTNSGFDLAMLRIPPGRYRFVAFAHSTVTEQFVASRITAPVDVQSTPAMVLDEPRDGSTVASGFTVRGWALNLAAASGTGVDAVHVYAYPVTGAPQFLGVASYGEARPDVGAVFASFTDSGFRLSSAALAPGRYLIVAFARDTVTGAFTLVRTASITVVVPVSDPRMALDTPPTGATLSQPFNIAGWAIDRGAPSGSGVDTGVDALHVWAWPVDGSPPMFVGVAEYGMPRPDVGAVFGSQFTNSGYNLHASTLRPGTYDLVVYVHSAVTGMFNNAQGVRITVQ